MTRFRLDIAYDGTNFHGWAAQPGRRTVQATLNQAIGELLAQLSAPPTHECPTGPVGPRHDVWKIGAEGRFELAPPQPPASRNRPPEPGTPYQPDLRVEEASVRSGPAGAPVACGSSSYQLTVAGRTDAGVHARAQVAHLDADLGPDYAAALAGRLPRLLPDDLIVRRVEVAPAGFDARFSAIGRTYCYRLWDDISTPFPPERHMVLPVRDHLDVTAMAQAADSLLGLRDFVAFCRPRATANGQVATTIRHLRRFDVTRVDDQTGTIECWLEADAFCHSMVRSLVGAVVAVGRGRRDMAWLERVVASERRANEVVVLPPQGLTLEGVQYPPDTQLGARAVEARQVRQL